MAEQIHHLARLRRIDSDQKAAKVLAALDAMVAGGQTIKIAALAHQAAVSRRFIYDHPELRAEAERRAAEAADRHAATVTASTRVTAASLRADLENAKAINRRLQPPPAAVKPDDIGPNLKPTDIPGGYDRYGFRVPAAVVSPYARKGYVSHVVHDHTSILKLVETKWNLPALTYRDASADNLLDFLDLTSPPAFLTPPSLPAPADASGVAACSATTPSPLPSART